MADQNTHAMYLGELKGVAPCSEEEITRLTEQLLAGDTNAAARLIEGNLHRVLPLASKLAGGRVAEADLVQEGNMALTMAVYEYADGGCGDFVEHITGRIREAIEDCADEQAYADETEKQILQRVQLLEEVSKKMGEELDRVPTVAELADRMMCTEDEVEALVKITIDALNAEE